MTSDPSSLTPSLSVPWVRVMLIQETEGPYHPPITQSHDVARLCADMLRLDREEFRVLLLNAKHTVIAQHTVSIGSLTVSIVHPREVYKAALLANAAAIIGVHNHPSGNPDPSPEDHALTKRLSEAGTLLGITLLDHVIIGEHTHYSFADQGQLSPPQPHPSP
ncbi:MAG: DNA repair protein RadC [Nitrospinota bacterium]|nr:DNA repair protein RadC [Nitrospira sp.]MDH5457073.1 DNA repair protein RadC [Nitrospinota bacterium]